MIALIIDTLGVSIGIFSILLIIKDMARTGGVVRRTLVLFVFGIGFQTAALLYTIIFVRLHLFSVPAGVDIHHVLMSVGLILFVFVARRLLPFLRGAQG